MDHRNKRNSPVTPLGFVEIYPTVAADSPISGDIAGDVNLVSTAAAVAGPSVVVGAVAQTAPAQARGPLVGGMDVATVLGSWAWIVRSSAGVAALGVVEVVPVAHIEGDGKCLAWSRVCAVGG